MDTNNLVTYQLEEMCIIFCNLQPVAVHRDKNRKCGAIATRRLEAYLLYMLLEIHGIWVKCVTTCLITLMG